MHDEALMTDDICQPEIFDIGCSALQGQCSTGAWYTTLAVSAVYNKHEGSRGLIGLHG